MITTIKQFVNENSDRISILRRKIESLKGDLLNVPRGQTVAKKRIKDELAKCEKELKDLTKNENLSDLSDTINEFSKKPLDPKSEEYIKPGCIIKNKDSYKIFSKIFKILGIEYIDVQQTIDEFINSEGCVFSMESTSCTPRSQYKMALRLIKNLEPMIPNMGARVSVHMNWDYGDFEIDFTSKNLSKKSQHPYFSGENDFLFENSNSDPTTSIKMVIMSHLSDTQEMFPDKPIFNNHINFAKYLLTKINDNTQIDPDAEWEAFTKTRFYRPEQQ